MTGLKKTIPSYFFIPPEESLTRGYTKGTRWDRQLGPREVYSAARQSPAEEVETRRHEYGHQAVDLSPNWSYITQLQRPTEELTKVVGQTYPKAMQLEENLIRQVEPYGPSNRPWTEIAGGLTETQKMLIPYLKRHMQYGPQWGSFVGPDYDERELREGKGQNIVPKFTFAPDPKEMRVPGVPRQVTQGYDPSLRLDGTKKGRGYFGPLPMTDGSGRVMTEYSKGIKLGDEEMLIPTLVPTLTQKELGYLLGGGTINDSSVGKSILNKAVEHAKERLAKGKSPFADEIQPEISEEEETTRDQYSPRWRDLVR